MKLFYNTCFLRDILCDTTSLTKVGIFLMLSMVAYTSFPLKNEFIFLPFIKISHSSWMKHKYVSISNNDIFSTSFNIYVHYSITCLLSDILCTTTILTLRNEANSVNFMTSHKKHISFSLVIIISSIWCIETHIQCLIHIKVP